MERPEYVGYGACTVVAIDIAAPVLSWCTSAAGVSYGCNWLAVIA